jgi:DNA-nicking Smr family endonuclease
MKPPRKTGAKGRGLSGEDHELWQHTARSLAPLKKVKIHVPTAADLPLGEPAPAPPRPEKPHKGAAHIHSAKGHAEKPAAVVKAPPVAIGAFDPRNTKKLRRGKIDIDARIDLHGMRQSEAHSALRRFLHAAHADGKRWVLVITGKGAGAGARRDEDGTVFGEPLRGVLKRNVPMWLHEPDLRPLIVSFTEASAEHGGSGALYVHLRRHDRVR